MAPFTYRVVAARVIDGDTFEATIDQGFHTLRKERFRLARINAPEIRSSDGMPALLALDDKLGSGVSKGTLTLTSIRTEKYGRWLAEVWIGDENVNDWMLAHGYAKEYG